MDILHNRIINITPVKKKTTKEKIIERYNSIINGMNRKQKIKNAKITKPSIWDKFKALISLECLNRKRITCPYCGRRHFL